MELKDIDEQDLLLLKCISGSKAQGLDTAESDTDIKGVFFLPKKEFYGLSYTPQVHNGTNDVVFYELERFMDLLRVNNPNILELLFTPSDKVIYKSSVLDLLKPQMFLSKLCKDTFGKYAIAQIKKAKGLNKKIVNPIAKERKEVLDFCYVNMGKGSKSLRDFLSENKMELENCGLQAIDHMPNLYALYHALDLDYLGVRQSKNSNDVSLSSIPKEEKAITLLYFNKDAYSTYCKKYKEYWDWVDKRNENRYLNTLKHNKNYDAKNMMHTFRLLEMAIEIGEKGELNVKRPNRDFLLKIKSGFYEYEELMKMAEERQVKMEKAFEYSQLPEKPDELEISKLMYQIRETLYKS